VQKKKPYEWLSYHYVLTFPQALGRLPKKEKGLFFPGGKVRGERRRTRLSQKKGGTDLSADRKRANVR